MANTLINFRKGQGLFGDYLTSLPAYSTNIVNNFAPNSILGAPPVMEPWVDLTHKQLWVNNQVINPKIKAASGSRIVVNSLFWDTNDGAVMTIDFNESGLVPPAPDFYQLMTGTYTMNNNGTQNDTSDDFPVYSDSIPYLPSSAFTTTNPRLSAIYFGEGLSYVTEQITDSTGTRTIGRVKCNLADGFLEDVNYNPTTHIMTFIWNTATGLSPQDVDLTDLIDPETPSYGTINLSNSPSVTTDVPSGDPSISASVPGDAYIFKAHNKWLNIQGTQSGSQGADMVAIGHTLSPIASSTGWSGTSGTYGDATHTPRITVDKAGHIIAVSEVTITGAGQTVNPYGLSGDVEGSGLDSKATWTLSQNGVNMGTVKLKHADQNNMGVGSDVSFTANNNEITMVIEVIDGGTFN